LKKEIRNIIIIGSGNVAYNLVNAFSSSGIRILQILARNERSAGPLAEKFKIPYILHPSELNKQADLYILAVQDDLISAVAHSLKLKDHLLVHTSGFSPLEILSGASENTGVFWPLQTLTSGKPTDYQHMPVFVEGSSTGNEQMLADFAGLISENVRITGSTARRQIHLAAVIASNLTNHLYHIAATLLEKYDIPFEVLVPLIRETAGKAAMQHPLLNQTGPAARNDIGVLEAHLEMLRDMPDYQEIYRLLTENIVQLHANNNEKL
jgi:predicted short-subunit dehydrogenase-like oxidoreductase (DUF2520 family)